MLAKHITQDPERAWLELHLVAECFRDFMFHDDDRGLYVTGWVSPNGSVTSYQLRLDIPPHFPHQKPSLFVTSPVTLWKQGGRERINDEGYSHGFHVLGTGHGGCCKICHLDNWDASVPLIQVLWMGILWLEAYAMHLRCGDDIDTCLTYLKQKARAG